MLKQVLLNTGYFVDNSYLDEYIELVQRPFIISGYSELHHKIPAYYYKKEYNLQTRYEAIQYAEADPANSLVRLPYAMHIKAHWLLSRCSLSKENEFAVTQMTSKIINKTSIKKTNGEILAEGLTSDEYLEITQLRDSLAENSDFYWSPWEDSWLIANYAKYSRKYCAQYLDKTEASIHKKAMTLGLKKASTKWTDEADSWLKINYPKYSLDECAKYLDRSYNAVIARLRLLNIPLKEKTVRTKMITNKSSRHNWKLIEEQWLLDNYDLLGIVGCAEKLNVSQSAIEHKISRLRKTK